MRGLAGLTRNRNATVHLCLIHNVLLLCYNIVTVNSTGGGHEYTRLRDTISKGFHIPRHRDRHTSYDYIYDWRLARPRTAIRAPGTARLALFGTIGTIGTARGVARRGVREHFEGSSDLLGVLTSALR